MNDKRHSPADPQDGFDLLEYPCEFAFKAMCRSDPDHPAADYIRGLITPLLDDQALRGITSRASRTGKYESVTATVLLRERSELEAVYQLIAQAPRVVMTL